ncbi:unnamed protein product [Periconia digitata]|uniref:Nudix hydrolase domain-containing protein n=1 Tax=Periconia digitata TaxID=1303443 RepID=A0A9W4U487_9PLEO|nr:unnamed protein product [Periconia digitata]
MNHESHRALSHPTLYRSPATPQISSNKLKKMATTKGKKPKSASRHITSENFVESCGAILFNLTDPQNLSVCLIRTKVHKEWLLAKGRRNYGESRNEAAIREVTEETGFRCSLFPVTMQTRATPPDAAALIADKARVFENLTEPFTCEIREYKNPKRTKIIWWYIAALDPSNEELEKLPGEADYEPHFLPVAEAITTLTYQADRKLVERAAQLVSETLNPLDRKELTNDDASNESTEKNQQNGGKIYSLCTL